MDDTNRLYEKLDKLDEKLDRKFEKQDIRVDNIEKQLIVYNEELKRHIEGVQLAREENKLLADYIQMEIEKMDEKIHPITQHIESKKNQWKYISKIFSTSMKVLGFVSLLVGIYIGFIRIVE